MLEVRQELYKIEIDYLGLWNEMQWGSRLERLAFHRFLKAQRGMSLT